MCSVLSTNIAEETCWRRVSTCARWSRSRSVSSNWRDGWNEAFRPQRQVRLRALQLPHLGCVLSPRDRDSQYASMSLRAGGAYTCAFATGISSCVSRQHVRMQLGIVGTCHPLRVLVFAMKDVSQAIPEDPDWRV